MTTPNLSSEGLRRFHALCVEPAPPEVTNGIWNKQRDWVEDHVPQAEIVQLYMALFHDLYPVRDAAAGTPEEQLADGIYDVLDIVWYAMTDESLEQVEALTTAHLKEHDPELARRREELRNQS